MIFRSFSSLAMLLSLLTCFGCGGASGAPEGLTGVTGKVSLNGQSLSQGTVSFVSANDGNAYSGQIQSDGTYQLKLSKSAAGAQPGDYKVSVISWETAPGMDEEGKTTEGNSAIPEKYMSSEESGLTATVTAAGPNHFDFDLK